MKFDRIKNSPFIKNVLTLAGGTGFAQIISIFTAPIVTRIYTPSDYGILGLYMMVTGLSASLATLQYNNAVIIEKDDIEAKNGVGLIIIIAAALSVFLFFILLIFKYKIALLLNSPELENWLLFAPLSIFINAWSAAFMAWANRTKSFKLMSTNRIIAAILVPIISISLGLLIKGPTGLIIGLLFGQTLAALLLSNYFIRKQGFRFSFNKVGIKTVASKHRNFPIYSLPAEFINNFVNQIPILMLGKYFGSASVGHFNLSNRMLGMPVGLLSGSVSEVFRQRASEDYKNNGSCEQIFLKTFKTLFLISIIPFTIIFFFGPQLFTTIFGNQWVEAGIFSKIMAPMFFLRFTISPLTYLFYIANKQKEDFFGHIFLLIIVFISFPISSLFTNNSVYFLINYSIAYGIVYLYYLIRSYNFSKGKK